MSCHVGNNMITDGLLFHYDMGNTSKSWQGSPTTNVSLQNGQNGTNPWLGDGAPTSLGIDPVVMFRGKKVAKFRTGSSGNCYLNGAAKLSTATLSTAWTTTIYLKRVDNIPLVDVGRYLYVSGNANVNLSEAVTPVENGWYKSTYTRSGLVSGYPTLTGLYGLGASTEYYFAGWQCEPLSFSSPYVDGSRTTSNSIFDVVNNHTITANSLIYSSTGEFSFTSGSFLTLPSNIGYTTEFSQFAWFKSTGAPTGGFHIIFGDANAEISVSSAGALRIGIQTPTRYVGDMGSGLTDGKWHNIGMVYNPTTNNIRGYIDGVFVGSVATNGSNPSTTFTRTIGRFGDSTTYYTNGLIDNAVIYNIALSDSDVLRNFDSLRHRYMTT